MIFHLTPVHQEAPVMINPAKGEKAYQSHVYVHEATQLRFILISYKDASDMINFAHYVEHPDGFIGSYVEGVCPAREDFEMVKKRLNEVIAEMHPEDPNAKLYRASFKFHSLQENVN
ncbi:MAG: hypothetical protein KAY50_00415 [Chitinophagaceae bacterium]|nr:hypothetical protein [Chitinophagaceae bacterium]